MAKAIGMQTAAAPRGIFWLVLFCIWTIACLGSLSWSVSVYRGDLTDIVVWARNMTPSPELAQPIDKTSSLKSLLALQDLQFVKTTSLSHIFLWIIGVLGLFIAKGRCLARPAMPVWPSSLQRVKSLDPTSSLPNEVVFKERVQIAVELAKMEDKSVAVAFLEPIRLAEVSNSMGYDASKELLWAIGQRLREALRDNDTVAQVERNRMKILLPSLAEPSDIYIVARKMFDTFATPYGINDDHYYIGVNIGISVFPTDAQNASSLMAHAAAALEKSQQENKSSYEIYR